MDASAFTNVGALASKEIAPGVTIQVVAGSAVMFSFVTLRPHSAVPAHQHPHEQIGYILEGEMEMWIGGERRTIRTGDAYVVPSNVPHGAQTGASTCVALDVFHPLRQEYLR